MAVWDSWLEGWMTKHGYTKASRESRRRVDVATIWSGEAGNNTTAQYGVDERIRNRERLAITCSWIFSDIQVIARRVSSIPFGIYDRAGEQESEVENHEFEQLLEWPTRQSGDMSSALIDQSWLLQYTVWWLLLHGEAYWMLGLDQAGGLASIWPLPANRVVPIPDAKNYIRGYAYKTKQGIPPIVLPTSQVCFFRLPNVFDYHGGLSPLTAALEALLSDTAAAKWNRKTFEDGLTLEALISVPAEISQPQFEQVQADIQAEMAKGTRFMIARAGDLDLKALGQTHRDAEYLEGRAFTRDEIDRVFGFPEGWWSQQANRSNSESADAKLIENTIWPIATGIARAITGQIIFPYYGDQLRGRFEDIRPRDRSLELREATVYWQALSLDEVRADRGLDPWPDEELGAKLFPLAVKGGGGGDPAAFGQIGRVGQFVEGSGEEPDEDEPEDESEIDTKAIRADLRRWRSVARRVFREGGDPAARAFESDVIPVGIKAAIETELTSATTEEEVRASFDAGFCFLETGAIHDWASYP